MTANNLDVLLDAEKHNSDGEVELKMATFRKPWKSKSKSKHARGYGEEDMDKEDLDFTMNAGSAPESSSDEISVDKDNDPVTISNTEVRKND